MIAKSGNIAARCRPRSTALREHLLPRADLVTPNAPEAAALTGQDVHSLATAREAALRLHALGPEGGARQGRPPARRRHRRRPLRRRTTSTSCAARASPSRAHPRHRLHAGVGDRRRAGPAASALDAAVADARAYVAGAIAHAPRPRPRPWAARPRLAEPGRAPAAAIDWDVRCRSERPLRHHQRRARRQCADRGRGRRARRRGGDAHRRARRRRGAELRRPGARPERRPARAPARLRSLRAAGACARSSRSRPRRRRCGRRRVSALHHRTGAVAIGEASIVIVAASAHRGEAFAACRYAIERVKQIAPIWKHEYFEGGDVWIEGAVAAARRRRGAGARRAQTGMRVTVRLFARLRDLAGTSELAADVAPGATIADVWAGVVDRHPALAPYAGRCRRRATSNTPA